MKTVTVIISSIICVLLIALMTVGSGQVLAADVSADMIQTTPAGNIQGKFFIKGDNVRTETNAQGYDQITITRKDKGLIWVIMPGNMFMEMEIPVEAKGQDFSHLDQKTLDEMATRENLGSEVVNGYKCDIYRFTFNDESMGIMTQWFSKEMNFPVKIEMVTPDGTIATEYRNIKQETLPESLFEVPSGYTKMQMPAGMPGMQPPGMKLPNQ